ncbi:AMP-binding protein [Microlunatus aurantiacus]|uniref:AMP-binding protein n=1 Tax=Microlunatus aurantiacus TaxID=446786 RepID=A0ABP7DM69_9ACTN
MNFSDFLLAQGEADVAAVVDGRQRQTYAELRRAAARIVAELQQAGVDPGARIGLLGGNSAFWVAGYLAAMKLGVVVPFSDKNGVNDLAAQADWVDCSAVLIDRRQQRRLGSAFGARPVITDAVLGENGASSWPITAADAAADAALMFTSGTTSRPKAVRATHGNLIANTTSIIDCLSLTASDRMLVILPFHYVFGASLLHTHLAVGGSIVLCNTFTFPETAVDLIDSEACTGFAGVPSSYQLLLRASSYGNRELGSLLKVQQAGGRLTPALIEELAAAQPGAEVFVMYGQTEATARLSYLPPHLLVKKLGSIGRGIPGVTLEVLNEAGTPVVPGEPGEIVARGANISPGYYNDPEATERKFRDGTLRTGDLATVDSEGFIFIVGRSGDFIKSWGYRVSPQQIEEVALAHPGVSEAAAVGLPDLAAGEAVTLAIVAVPDMSVDVDALLELLRSRLPKHMVPEVIHVLGALPLTASGKIAKPELRELLAGIRSQVPSKGL